MNRVPPHHIISRGDHLFFRRLRAETFRGNIHSIFKKAFNVREYSTGKLFTFCAEQGWIGPDTLNLPIRDIHGLGLEINDSIQWDGTYFFSQRNILFSLDARSSGHDLLIPPYPENENCIKQKKDIMTEFLKNTAHSVFSNGNHTHYDPFSAELHRMLTHATAEFSKALLCDTQEAVIHGKRCLGLGSGLTPTGDDFLVGFFSVLHMKHSPAYHKHTLCPLIAQEAPQRTTDISAAILTNASYGRVLTLISDLLLFLNADHDTFLGALHKLSSLGSSSGSDISWGIISGLELNLQLSHS